MTAWYRAMGAGLLLVWLSGCGGSDEEAGSEPDESTTTTAETREPSPEPSPKAPEVPPFDQPLMIDVSSSLGTDRRLTVKGETNLPEATRLQVLVERELSGMRWRERVSVEEGGFMAGPFGPGSGLPDGGYRVTVEVQEGSVQPRSVRERLGEKNEHLSGPLVEQSGHGLGQVARYSQRYLVGDDARRTVDNVEVMEME